MFCETIYEVALLFDSLQKTNNYSGLFDKVLEEGKEQRLSAEVHNLLTKDQPNTITAILSAYNFLIDNMTRITRYDSVRDQEKKFHIVRAFVIDNYLHSFTSTKVYQLKKKVYKILYPNLELRERKNESKAKESFVPSSINNWKNEDDDLAIRNIKRPILPSIFDTLENAADGNEEEEKDDEPESDGMSICSPPIDTTPAVPVTPVATSLPKLSDILHTEGRFDNCQCVTPEFLQNEVSSVLLVETERQLYVLEQSPVEVYLATNLKQHKHGRTTVLLKDHQTPFVPHPTTSTTMISSKVQSFLDPNDVLSVARPGSDIFNRVKRLDANVFALAKYIAHNGKSSCDSRQTESLSVKMSWGVNATLENESNPLVLYGGPIDDPTAAHSMGAILDFIWNIAQEIQKENNLPPLSGNLARMKKYCVPFQEMMLACIMGFECADAILNLVWPASAQCSDHYDRLNDLAYRYSKTACFDFMFIDAFQYVWNLQILGNFRQACFHRMCPKKFAPKLRAIVDHITDYHTLLKEKYSAMLQKFDGILSTTEPSFLRDVTDLTDWIWEDGIPFQNVNLVVNDNVDPIDGDFFFCPIGCSRVFSFSMILHPIYKLSHQTRTLKLDQIVELLFLASFFATPVNFNEALNQLIGDTTHTFGTHPFYDLIDRLNLLFPSIQSGICPRYQPCSNQILLIFTRDKPHLLESVIEVLFGWIGWIDGFQEVNSIHDIKLSAVEAKMKLVCEDIKEACGETELDFGCFRLGVFTTLVSGLGILQPGEHVHQFIIPTPGTASSNHILSPADVADDVIDGEGESLPEESLPDETLRDGTSVSCLDKDNMMEYVAGEFRWGYRRDVVETTLCESVPGRCLDKQDVFRKNEHIFWLRKGIPMYKKYNGRRWLMVSPPPQACEYIIR